MKDVDCSSSCLKGFVYSHIQLKYRLLRYFGKISGRHTYVDVRKPDVLSGIWMQQDVGVVVGVVAQDVVHLQPRISPVHPKGGLQSDELE